MILTGFVIGKETGICFTRLIRLMSSRILRILKRDGNIGDTLLVMTWFIGAIFLTLSIRVLKKCASREVPGSTAIELLLEAEQSSNSPIAPGGSK